MRRTLAPLALVILGSLLGISPAQAQPFGPNEQVLTLGASAFRPTVGTNTTYSYGASDGYLHGNGDYVAPVDLPDGAEIVAICADVYSMGGGGMGAQLEEVQLPDSGIAGNVYLVPGGDATVVVLPIGFSANCNTGALDYVVHSSADLGSGLRNLAHRVRYSGSDAALGAVRIYWHRQVSPAPALATFNDVPTTHPFFQYIEALAASGITGGCGGGNYCPDNPLTRGQMAVFMAKALGLNWGLPAN